MSYFIHKILTEYFFIILVANIIASLVIVKGGPNFMDFCLYKQVKTIFYQFSTKFFNFNSTFGIFLLKTNAAIRPLP